MNTLRTCVSVACVLVSLGVPARAGDEAPEVRFSLSEELGGDGEDACDID